MRYILFWFIFFISIQILCCQPLFVEERGWGISNERSIDTNSEFDLHIDKDTLIVGDTFEVKYYYQNKKLAIRGKCYINKKGWKVKFGKWNFYYPNKKIWSERKYHIKGYLIEISKLLSKKGKDLKRGYSRPIGRYGALSGHEYQYNENSELVSIIDYKIGKISKRIELSNYSSDELKRLYLRKYPINDSIYLEELSLEEALFKQSVDSLPILLHASTVWNGHSKRWCNQLNDKPELAKFISDNFHFSFIDVEDSKDVLVETTDTVYLFKSKTNGKYHEALTHFVPIPKGTPYFLFIEEGQGKYFYYGIEEEDEDFLKILNFYLSERYLIEDWDKFEKSLN